MLLEPCVHVITLAVDDLQRALTFYRDDPATVTCVIPGHEQAGEELVAEHMKVDDPSLRFEHQGNCGYAVRFDYGGG